MGIKGIYDQLPAGKRVALSKLAAESFDTSGRPLRLAIDFAIWQYQNQAAQGGTNPAIRNLFYRLVRLLGTPIQPIFVFDGPEKPKLKRNKRSGRGCSVSNAQAKRLIRYFGFAFHDAPGEAEAECALLQTRGIVDAVLSEDVDTIMFGCTRTVRKWTPELKGSKNPTHVSLYDTHDMNISELGLDRDGTVLVALMSGGDYLPEGIPNCGVKVACEAAKAGFGKSLCRLKASDENELRLWKENLIHELRSNESKFFRTKHKALVIPEDFPNLEVLRCYTHPAVSPLSKLESVEENLARRRPVELEGLREYTRETFGWVFRIGAIKFIRVMAAAVLVQKLLHKETENVSLETISKRRLHVTTDGIPEFRLRYVPQDIVPIDISGEVDEQIASSREGLALNSDDDFETIETGIMSSQPDPAKVYDITKPDHTWVLESVMRKTVPELVRKWEDAEQAKILRKSPKKKAATRGIRTTKSSKDSEMPRGALDKFVKHTKATKAIIESSSKAPSPRKSSPAARATPPPEARRLFTMPSPSPPSRSKQDTYPPTNPATQVLDSPSSDLPMAPRTPSKPDAIVETIVLSSSPAGAPSRPVSSPPRRQLFPATATSRATFPIVSTHPTAKEVKSRPTRKMTRSKTAISKTSQTIAASPGSRYKQTTMDLFTTKSDSSLITSSQLASSQLSPMPRLHARSDDVDPFASSEDELPGLPRLSAQDSPKSPSKRLKSPVWSGEETSPTRRPGARKKQFSALDAACDPFVDDYAENPSRRDTKRGSSKSQDKPADGKSAHVRWSEVSLIDLTQDD